MLVLSRKTGESIRIGDHIEIKVIRIGPNVVRIGDGAPFEGRNQCDLDRFWLSTTRRIVADCTWRSGDSAWCHLGGMVVRDGGGFGSFGSYRN